jgi:hypothetical protein
MNTSIIELVYNYLLFDDKIKLSFYLNDTYLMKKTYNDKYNNYLLISKNLTNEIDRPYISICMYCDTVHLEDDTWKCGNFYQNNYDWDDHNDRACVNCVKIYGKRHQCVYCDKYLYLLNCRGQPCQPYSCCNNIICGDCLIYPNATCKDCNTKLQ